MKRPKLKHHALWINVLFDNIIRLVEYKSFEDDYSINDAHLESEKQCTANHACNFMGKNETILPNEMTVIKSFYLIHSP